MAKYSSICPGLLVTYELPFGKRHYSLTAMKATHPKSIPGFHEIDHVFHGTGIAVTRDFTSLRWKLALAIDDVVTELNAPLKDWPYFLDCNKHTRPGTYTTIPFLTSAVSSQFGHSAAFLWPSFIHRNHV